MITVKQWLETNNYRISEGSKFYWACFGKNAYTLDAWNEEPDGYSSSIVFDTLTQEVYQVSVYDYKNNRAYRMISTSYIELHTKELREKNVGGDWAWDDVPYTDLEVDEDFLTKMSAIIAGQEYDTNISVPLDLEKDLMFDLMLKAHEQNITLNQLVENILRNMIDEVQYDAQI